jgi:ATP-dependent protease ClpP protease subunit
MTKLKFSIVLLTSAMMLNVARAADFTSMYDADSGPVIKLTGEIVEGDFARFSAALESMPKASIVLESGGGRVEEGLAIGGQVFKNHLPTIVQKNKTCASAGALIWLAGDPRYAFDKARIGFHAARDGLGVSATGNAIAAVYLHELGMSNETIRYLVSARPESMEWLDPAKAKQFGIDFIWKKS